MAFAVPAPFRRLAEAAAVAASLAAVYLLIEPYSADHAAQQFRTGLFELDGAATWNNLWFGGHHVPGYSVLFPPLGALLGPRLAGAIAAVAAALLFASIAERQWGRGARFGIAWFAAGTAINLFTGRLTFALGVTIALAAVFAAQRGYRRTSLCLAVACPLASPVAALFLACGGAAYWFASRARSGRLGLELAACSFGAALVLTAAFPEGGSEPFVSTAYTPAILGVVSGLIALPREERLLRAGVLLWGLALTASFLIPNPLGGNATRMGALLLGPLLACALWNRPERVILVFLAPLIMYWQFSPVMRDLERVHAQPSVKQSYYAPVQEFIASKTSRDPARVEIVPMENHWEAALVPPADIPIARGWERQLDRKLNPLFYDERLSATGYRLWLDWLAVRYVALSNGPLDYAGESEAALIRSGLPYLKPVFKSPDWTLYKVRHATPLAQRPARVTELEPSGFSIRAPRPGSYLVHVRHSPYFSLAGGVGCVEASPGGLTTVHMTRAGTARVDADFSPIRIFNRGRVCRSKP